MPVQGRLPSLAGAGEWLNARPPMTQRSAPKSRPSQILDTRINWLRSLPYEHGLKSMSSEIGDMSETKSTATSWRSSSPLSRPGSRGGSTTERPASPSWLQAFCKHRASAAMSPYSAQMHGRGRKLARSLRLGGIRRNTCTQSRRLITRRSQVQILPPLLRRPSQAALLR
jgi:hypothetical protein